jgi:hypothetical protein
MLAGIVTNGMRQTLVDSESGPAHLYSIGIVSDAGGIFSRT